MEKQRKRISKAFIFFLLVIFAGIAYLFRGYYLDKLKMLINISGLGTAEITFTVTEAKATEILSDILKEESSFKNLSVTFQNGKIAVFGDISVRKIITESVTSNYPELSSVVQLLPEVASASVWVEVDVDNGNIRLSPDGFELNGWKIPLGLLPKSYKEAIGEMIIKATDVNSIGLEFLRVSSQNGKLTVETH